MGIKNWGKLSGDQSTNNQTVRIFILTPSRKKTKFSHRPDAKYQVCRTICNNIAQGDLENEKHESVTSRPF